MSELSWRQSNRQPLIPVTILTPEGAQPIASTQVAALLDTGSTISGVTLQLARHLRLPMLGKGLLASARNEDQVQRYLFRIGLTADALHGAPSYPFVFEDVIGFELKNGVNFQALVGMDILHQCDLVMLRSGECRLSFGS